MMSRVLVVVVVLDNSCKFVSMVCFLLCLTGEHAMLSLLTCPVSIYQVLSLVYSTQFAQSCTWVHGSDTYLDGL